MSIFLMDDRLHPSGGTEGAPFKPLGPALWALKSVPTELEG